MVVSCGFQMLGSKSPSSNSTSDLHQRQHVTCTTDKLASEVELHLSIPQLQQVCQPGIYFVSYRSYCIKSLGQTQGTQYVDYVLTLFTPIKKKPWAIFMVSPERQICQMSWCSSSQVNEDSKERRLRFIIDYYSIVIHQEALRWVLNGSHSTQLLHFGVSHKHPQRCQPSVSSECQSTWSLRELAANCYELLPGWCSSKRIQCHFPWWLFGSKARTPVKSFGCFTPIKGVCESIGKPQIAKLLVHLECRKTHATLPEMSINKSICSF